MAQKKLLTNGKAFKRIDDRWGGTVWYMDEKGERKRKFTNSIWFLQIEIYCNAYQEKLKTKL